MLKEINVVDTVLQFEQEKDRNSSSTATTDGQCSSPYFLHGGCQKLTRQYDERLELFKISKSLDSTTQKLIQKAIHWIQLKGYTHNLSFETITLSIALFYATANYMQIDKTCLQSILCTCLKLASKMTSRPQISMQQLLGIVNNRQNAKTILEHQQKILLFLDFNIHFQFPIFDQLIKEEVSKQQQYKAQFLIQLLLQKQSTLFYDTKIVQELFQIISGDLGNMPKELLSKIKKILKKNQLYQHLVCKYKSYFDVSSFILQINDIYIHI